MDRHAPVVPDPDRDPIPPTPHTQPVPARRRLAPSGRRVRRAAFAPLLAGLILALPTDGLASPGVDLGELLQGSATPARTRSFDWVREPATAVYPLSAGERALLERRREQVDAAARRHFGRSLRGDASDLDLLQRFLDEGVFARDDTQSLQALGVVLGDVLVREFSYRWVAIDDAEGHARAVQDPVTGRVHFPITALSRRYAAGAPVDVHAIHAQLAPGYARSRATEAARAPSESWVERLR